MSRNIRELEKKRKKKKVEGFGSLPWNNLADIDPKIVGFPLHVLKRCM